MKQTMKYAWRMWGIYAVLTLLCLFFVASIENQTLELVLNAALLVGFGMLIFGEGGYNGEKACTLQAMLDRQMKEGRRVDQQQYKDTFSKKNALRMFVVMSVPFLLVSLVNLAVYPLYPEPETAIVETQDESASSTGFLIEDVSDDVEAGQSEPFNFVFAIARLFFMPFCSLYSLVSTKLMNLLFIPLSFVLPAAATVGYLRGPSLREKKLKDIAKGKRRKLRKMRREREANRGPKAEV